MSNTTEQRIERLKEMLHNVKIMPEYQLTLAPAKDDALQALAGGLPPDHLRMLSEIGEICLSYNDCCVIDSYLPCRLSKSPFYTFDPDLVLNFENLLIYAHDVDGQCYGYDTSRHPFESCVWDFHYGLPRPLEHQSGFDIVESAIVEHLKHLERAPRMIF